MLYEILAYNNLIHSVTRFKPIDIINGHITTNNTFNLDVKKPFVKLVNQRKKL